MHEHELSEYVARTIIDEVTFVTPEVEVADAALLVKLSSAESVRKSQSVRACSKQLLPMVVPAALQTAANASAAAEVCLPHPERIAFST